MSLTLTIFGVAFAAFCVWLTVRIVGRRERWAKWTLATVVSLPVLYVASFGPACWLVDRELLPSDPIELAFRPIVRFLMNGENPVVRRTIVGYASICGGEDTALSWDSNWWWDTYVWADDSPVWQNYGHGAKK